MIELEFWLQEAPGETAVQAPGHLLGTGVRPWGQSRDFREYGYTHPRELSGAIPCGALFGAAGARPSAVVYPQMLYSGDDCHPGSVG